MIVGPEQQRLTEIESGKLVNPSNVAAILPETVVKATELRQQELALSLEPTVTQVVRTFAQKEPEVFGEILSPTIGAAVRKAVTDAITALLERFNETLERSLSLRSISWRIEARRTGRPLAEVILLRNLVYRVEQVFLVHPRTGLLLEHVKVPSTGVEDPDQVVSMLEAIDAYVRESLGEPDMHLSKVQMGDLVIWVDRHPAVAIAAVVRGVAPPSLGEALRETRERIYLAYRAELARFESDVSPFASSRPELEQCLRMERTAAPRRAQRWLAVAGAVLLVAIGLLVARSVQIDRRLVAYTHALEDQPGIALRRVEHVGRRARLEGLRDPLAESPSELIRRAGLPAAELRFDPFYSLDPRIVVRRARRSLQPPEGVKLVMDQQRLVANGLAPRRWIERARTIAPTLGGVERYDDAAVLVEEDVRALRGAAAALTHTWLPFEFASSELADHDAVRRAVARTAEVRSAAQQARVPVCIVVTGYASSEGSPAANQRLSEARAQRVAEVLVRQGVPASELRFAGGGIRRVGSIRQARGAAFQVDLGNRCKVSP